MVIFSMSLLAALLVGLIGLLYLYIKYKLSYWERHGYPYMEPKFLFGNFKDALFRKKNMACVMADLYNELGERKYGGAYLLLRPLLIIKDPDVIKMVLVKDFQHFVNHGGDFSEKADPLQAKMLLNMKGERWKGVRAKLSPTFTSGRMKKMLDLVVECSRELSSHLEITILEDNVVEAKDLMAKYTTDAIASCAFGIQCNSFKDPNSEFRLMGKELFDPPDFLKGLKIFVMRSMPAIAKFLQLSFVTKRQTNFFRSVVRDTMDYREKNGVLRNDFMDLLIQLKKRGFIENDEDDDDDLKQKAETVESDVVLDHDDLTAQALIFFVGGFETSSTTMSFALYEMALNPEIEERVRDEIDDVLQRHNGSITYDAIQEMEYLHQVISETLRKYPPIPFTDRKCTKNYTFPDSGCILNAGSSISVPIFGLHYDPRYYPEPEKFDPERFSEQNKKTRHHYVYLPFGEGPRACIGTRFAFMQMKVGLATLLSNFVFKRCMKTSVPIALDPNVIFLTSKDGVWLQVEKRKRLCSS